MARIKLPYVYGQTTRHGRVVYYFRKHRKSKCFRMPGSPGEADFMAAYHACLEGREPPQAKCTTSTQQITPVTDRKSFRWLCQQYLTSRTFQGLDVKTRKPRLSILNQICELEISDSNKKKIGEVPFEDLHSRAVRRIRDRKAETPEAANNWLKAIKAVFKWGLEEEHCSHNPAREVPKINVPTEGFYTWTLEEVEQFEAYYPIGTRPRLALALLLYTGCRRGDVVAFGPQHIKDGWLTYTQQKNQSRKPVTLSVPVLPALAEVLENTDTEHLTFLVSEYGRPYTIEGFGKRWRKWAAEAGLAHCTPHGLRKVGASRAAENDATPHQMMAIFGWSDIKQAERYTKKARQKKLAEKGMEKLTQQPRESNVTRLKRR